MSESSYEVTEIRATAFSYKTVAGESWGNVARKTRGDDTLAVVIKKANPGISEPLPDGVMITIPALSSLEAGLSGDELEILVDGQKIGTSDDFGTSYAIDGIRKASFSVPNCPEMRAIFKPLFGVPAVIGSTGKLLISGRCLSPDVSSDTLKIDVVSDAEPIERCNAPISAYPLEFIEQDLEQIATSLLSPLGFTVEFLGASGAKFSESELTESIGSEPSDKDKKGARFSKTSIDQDVNVLDFLSELAKQRNLTITAKADGTIVFWREAAAGAPVATLDASMYPVVDTSLKFDDDKFYSSVTGVLEADPKKKKPARAFTVSNPYAKSLQRPYTFTAQDCDDGELETVVQCEAARMFAAVFSVDVEVCTWRDDAGEIWQPNTTVLIKDPQNYLEDFFEMTISEVSLTKTANSKGATLKLTLPGCYGGVIPEAIPWQ